MTSSDIGCLVETSPTVKPPESRRAGRRLPHVLWIRRTFDICSASSESRRTLDDVRGTSSELQRSETPAVAILTLSTKSLRLFCWRIIPCWTENFSRVNTWLLKFWRLVDIWFFSTSSIQNGYGDRGVFGSFPLLISKGFTWWRNRFIRSWPPNTHSTKNRKKNRMVAIKQSIIN